MAVATTVRLDFTAQAQTILLASGLVDDTFEVVAGKLEGPQADKDRGGVWVAVTEPDQEKVLQVCELHLRVFKRFYASRGADVIPYDPTLLEAVGEAVQTAFNGLHANVPDPGGWYEVIRQEFMQEIQGVEVTVLAFSHNLFAP